MDFNESHDFASILGIIVKVSLNKQTRTWKNIFRSLVKVLNIHL